MASPLDGRRIDMEPAKVGNPQLISADVQSPGLGAAAGLGAAFELKFQLDPDLGKRIEEWAAINLLPDKHGDSGRYSITSVYCDTPELDVFHRSPGYRRSKFRLRRYDASSHAFLERKRKRGDRVLKRRTLVPADELAVLSKEQLPSAWAGDWFYDRVRSRNLRPTACVTYRRAAFFGMAGDMPVRLTIDRDLMGLPADAWHIPHVKEGTALLPEGVLLELKFHLHMPPLFRDLLALLPAQAARMSKYRRCVSACGLFTGVTPPPGIANPPRGREIA